MVFLSFHRACKGTKNYNNKEIPFGNDGCRAVTSWQPLMQTNKSCCHNMTALQAAAVNNNNDTPFPKGISKQTRKQFNIIPYFCSQNKNMLWTKDFKLSSGF